MKSTISFIVAAAAVLIFLFVLSSGKKIPAIPADALHQPITTNEACATCHGSGRQAPLKPSHPPKKQCLTCHKPLRK